MKLEKKENLKSQNVIIIQTTTSQINFNHETDTEFAEKVTQKLNTYE